MNTYGVDLMGRRRRRRHSAEFKAAVIQECRKPGVSMAAVALAHGLNATMVRKWVVEVERNTTPSLQGVEAAVTPGVDAGFVPLALPAPAERPDIQIELQRAGTTVKIVWPAAAASQCAAWLAEWLR
ncbi:transposase [Ramlibacter sp. RBP-2]|uniref:Transposase n=1 Tax=Ramlibacter lithotrophicus TaxID=2606681 RepID=A0A7X6DL41_9BURK|nr:transposase [Ramlibacter lithotrophicus]NKE69127.1 transposase [Ramlibacter lithotrophicus]